MSERTPVPADAIDVACPRCGARAGSQCHDNIGYGALHFERRQAASPVSYKGANAWRVAIELTVPMRQADAARLGDDDANLEDVAMEVWLDRIRPMLQRMAEREGTRLRHWHGQRTMPMKCADS